MALTNQIVNLTKNHTKYCNCKRPQYFFINTTHSIWMTQ